MITLTEIGLAILTAIVVWAGHVSQPKVVYMPTQKKRRRKIYFVHGTVSSGKTIDLMRSVRQYQLRDRPVKIIKPALDSRSNTIWSRFTKDQLEVDIMLEPGDVIPDLGNTECVFVDEVQFLTIPQIEQLAVLATKYPIICYGLISDYKLNMFPAITKLLVFANERREVKSICDRCPARAMFNMKLRNGRGVFTGESVDPGTHYTGVCFGCYEEERISFAED